MATVKGKQKDGKTKIYIKPSKRGSLRKEMGVKGDEKISSKELSKEKKKAKKEGDTALMKKVVFAQNARSWNK